MKSFTCHVIEKQNITRNILKIISEISEYKEKLNLLQKQSPQILKKLSQFVVVESTVSSNKIWGTASNERIVPLVVKGKTAKSFSEEEILKYKYVFNLIRKNHQPFPFKTNLILQFHKYLFKNTMRVAGKWKISNNAVIRRRKGKICSKLKTISALKTSEAMNQLQKYLNKAWRKNKTHKLLLIATYILDFLKIHPFQDGNGRTSMLLTLMLLNASGYYVGKYISIEKIMNKSYI